MTAFNSVGESDPSNEMSATPPVAGDTTPPAKPGNLKALLSGTSQIALDWVDSTDNTGVAYRVYRDATLVGTVQDSRFLDSGLAPGSTHVYQVRAIDGSGNESLPSSNLSARAASHVDGLDRNARGSRPQPGRQARRERDRDPEAGERHAQEREDELERRLEAVEPARAARMP